MYDDILDATIRVLNDDGVTRTSTTRIADRAGISAGSLYQYFANRDAIFVALDARQFNRLSDRLAGQIADRSGLDLDASLGRMVDAVFEAQDGLRAVRAIFSGDRTRTGIDDPVSRQAECVTVHVRHLLDRHAEEFPDGFDIAQAAFSIACLVQGFLQASTRPGAPRTHPAPMARDIKVMLQGYLATNRR